MLRPGGPGDLCERGDLLPPPPPLPETRPVLVGALPASPGALIRAPHPRQRRCWGLFGTAVAWDTLSPATASPEVAQRGSSACPRGSPGGLLALGVVCPPFPRCPAPLLASAALGVDSHWSPLSSSEVPCASAVGGSSPGLSPELGGSRSPHPQLRAPCSPRPDRSSRTGARPCPPLPAR